jgi:hypothetical protein
VAGRCGTPRVIIVVGAGGVHGIRAGRIGSPWWGPRRGVAGAIWRAPTVADDRAPQRPRVALPSTWRRPCRGSRRPCGRRRGPSRTAPEGMEGPGTPVRVAASGPLREAPTPLSPSRRRAGRSAGPGGSGRVEVGVTTALRADLCVVGLGRRIRCASRRMPMRRAFSPEACPTRKCGASARSGARRRGSDCAFLRGWRSRAGWKGNPNHTRPELVIDLTLGPSLIDADDAATDVAQ